MKKVSFIEKFNVFLQFKKKRVFELLCKKGFQSLRYLVSVDPVFDALLSDINTFWYYLSFSL